MERPRNPFILGHRISRLYFCDRFEEQRTLMSAVVNGRNVVMISPRRMGKTSLAYVALHDSEEIRAEYQTFFIDILQTNTLSEFTFLLGKTIFDELAAGSENRVRGFLAALKSLKGTFGFDALTGTPTFNLQLGDIKRPEYTLEEIFNYLEHGEKPIVIIIDEFQQITKYPEKNTEAILRSHMQRLTNASFVFAGSEQTLLREMFVSAKRPFYNSAEIMHLGPIDEEIYIDFARRLFVDYGKEIEAQPIREVFTLLDGNTFYLQRTMNGAFAETGIGTTCGRDTVMRSLRAMLASNEVIYREMLSKVSASQKALLCAIAKEKTADGIMSSAFVRKHSLASASSVQSAMLKLSASGMISRTEAGYSLTDPLMRIFINGLYSTAEI